MLDASFGLQDSVFKGVPESESKTRGRLVSPAKAGKKKIEHPIKIPLGIVTGLQTRDGLRVRVARVRARVCKSQPWTNPYPWHG
jgi:hypothetical protein